METQTLNHFHMTKCISLIAMVGVCTLNPSTGIAVISEYDPKNDVIQGQEERGQIIIEGEVTRVQGEFMGKDFSHMKDLRYIVETPLRAKWDLHLGENTQRIGDIFLGDHIRARVGKNGSLQTVQKIDQKNMNSPNSVVRHHITGTSKKKDRDFLFVKQGDDTETLHLDNQSTLEENFLEGSNIVAQFGDAGYAIRLINDETGLKDHRLQKAVWSTLRDEDVLRQQTDTLRLRVKHGIVTVSGQVDTEIQKAAAWKAAGSVSGVEKVINAIHVGCSPFQTEQVKLQKEGREQVR